MDKIKKNPIWLAQRADQTAVKKKTLTTAEYSSPATTIGPWALPASASHRATSSCSMVAPTASPAVAGTICTASRGRGRGVSALQPARHSIGSVAATPTPGWRLHWSGWRLHWPSVRGPGWWLTQMTPQCVNCDSTVSTMTRRAIHRGASNDPVESTRTPCFQWRQKLRKISQEQFIQHRSQQNILYFL